MNHIAATATRDHYDAIVIGSGFGGSMMAKRLVDSGRRVLLVERGDWVRRGPENWGPSGSMELTPHYSDEAPYRVVSGGYGKESGACFNVGGPSVFYGGVSFRFREADFQPASDIVCDSGAAWPWGYRDLERYYDEAERLLGVSGDDRVDPTRPPRAADFLQSPLPLAPISQRIAGAAASLGLNPFHLPLAINTTNGGERAGCTRCRKCDTFACAIEAKNDVATCVIQPLIDNGLELATNTVVTRLVEDRGRLTAVDCFDKDRNAAIRYTGDLFVLSAGALASPHLLLASDLPRLNPGGHVVGRYLMRHCNAMVFGVFPSPPDPDRQFHKQLGIHDYYFGVPGRQAPVKLGGIQQVMTPPAELVRARLPRGLRPVLSPMVEHLTGMLAIAEDQPRFRNGVSIDRGELDRFGMPKLAISLRHSRRDRWAVGALVRLAKRVLGRAGAWFFYTHAIRTFSHAVGTVRMGPSPETSALDEFCRFRGVENLYVVDGSFMPTSAAVNPSLTIAANALRVGDFVVQNEF
jgi:choline dehydrogenase-like flavoprotein